MKKTLQYLLVFIICWAWALPLRAQLFADHSRDEYQNNFWLKDTVKLVYKGALKGKDSLRTLDLRFKGNNSIFRGEFDASEVRFDKTATFASSEFHWAANFTKTEFHWAVDFSSAVFRSTIKFDGTNFYDKVNFQNVEFKQVPEFVHTYFMESVSFEGVKVPGKMLFIDVDISDFKASSIDLRGIDTGDKPCYIDLRGTDVRKVILDYAKFQVYFDSNYSAVNGDDTTQVKTMYEGIIFQQYNYGFQAGLQKAVKEYDAWKKNLRARVKAGTWRSIFDDGSKSNLISWQLGFALIAIILIILLVSRNRNSHLATSTKNLNTIRPVVIPAQKIAQNVERGTELWQSYEHNPASKNEHFWTQYESLIGKAKSQK